MMGQTDFEATVETTMVKSLTISEASGSDRTDIAIFLPSLGGGGAERVMMSLANAFAVRGLGVDLVLASAEGPFLEDVSPEVRIIDLGASRVMKALFPLVKYIRRRRPRAMLSALGHANVVAIVARMLSRVDMRLIISERSTPSEMSLLSQGLRGKINGWLVPLLYPRADGISTVSDGVSRDLIKRTGLRSSQVMTIYNPFDLEGIEANARQPIESDWFTSSNSPTILAIGRLTEQKDFSVLIRAFALIRRAREIRLLILGEGEQRGELEALVGNLGLSKEDVRMPGFVRNPHRYLARCDLFVLSSRTEGLPGALVEAIACGAPVVSTDCPSGPDEILEGGRWGRLVPVGDVEALATAMAEVLDTPRHERPDVRTRARDFGQEKAVDAYLALLGVSCQ
ncbi:MAG: glycosyltransferase [Anaerolineae bacterium]|jgi:glycosyltransferase involved in cell wall biosynthesis|nr:glycosyltransferase [Anaerolineae bacterium]